MISCIDYHLASHGAVEQKIDEILIIVEPDAIGDPGAVMVHLQDTPVTLTAVMSSIGLSPQTSLTHSDATHLFLFNREILREFHCSPTTICWVSLLI